MMDRDLFRKLEDEHSLTPDEWLRLDEALDSEDARFTQTLVRSLTSEEPSLAWRSDLNVRLAQSTKAQRKRQTLRRWLPVMAAPVAAGCAVMLMLSISSRVPSANVAESLPPSSRTHDSIEARMIDFHSDAVTPLAVGANVPYEANGTRDLPDLQF